MHLALLAVASTVLLSACTWVHLAPAAKNVRVIPAGATPAAIEAISDATVLDIARSCARTISGSASSDDPSSIQR